MSLDLNQLYNLLPAVYRIRDAELALQLGVTLDSQDLAKLQALRAIVGPLTAKQERELKQLEEKQQRGPLKALMSVIAEQVEVLEESINQAYDDQFIETCRDWVVPYIGDLLGARGVYVFPNAPFSARAFVADTLTLRRRKGTVPALERLARDVTGWDANVVEYFQVLATTQYMNHLRPGNLSMSNVRKASHQLLNTPFDPYAHNVDVRNIASRRGKYNIPNIGIFLWRIPENPMEQSPAFRLDDRRYLFDAIGRDTQLFPFSQPEDQVTQRATPLNVPMPITRRMLYDHLADYYGVGPAGGPPSILLLGSPPYSITVCDLRDVKDAGGHVIGWGHAPQDTIGIDPELGRIAFPTSQPPPRDVHVSYYYGFSAPMGGGQYERLLTAPADRPIVVPGDEATIQAALNRAVTQLAGSTSAATIEVRNNEYYIETPSVNVPPGKSIELRAAAGKRPVLVLSDRFVVTGGAGSAFQLNGLLVSGGSLTVPAKGGGGQDNALGNLKLSHCTLAPTAAPRIGSRAAESHAAPRLWIAAPNVKTTIDKCILGSLRASADCTVEITNSIVDALSKTDIAYVDPDGSSGAGPLTIRNTTVVGRVRVRIMNLASNTIFLAEVAPYDLGGGPVHAEQLQTGCVRFSFVPSGSQVPREYRCHPDPDDEVPVHPAFTSLRFGDPGYCQLARQSGVAILQGADDQSEMGAFHDLFQPQREANLQAMVQDFLRIGLEAGIFHAS
jgi:hypothetical protein